MITIKTLRRAENEIDSEIEHIRRRLRNRKATTSRKTAAEEGAEACVDFLTRFKELSSAKYEIRAAVSFFNEEEGINKRMVQIAKLDALLEATVSCEQFGPVIERSSYTNKASEYTVGISNDIVDAYRSDARGIRREIQALKDSCNGINSSKDSAKYVSTEMIEFLKDNNFID